MTSPLALIFNLRYNPQAQEAVQLRAGLLATDLQDELERQRGRQPRLPRPDRDHPRRPRRRRRRGGGRLRPGRPHDQPQPRFQQVLLAGKKIATSVRTFQDYEIMGLQWINGPPAH